MATARHIVNGALRKLGRLGAGREPRVADQTDALAALQGLYSSWVVAGALGRLTDVMPLTDYTAGENQRIMRDRTTVTVTLPDAVPAFSNPLPYNLERDTYAARGQVVDCNARPPRDAAVVQIMDTNGGEVETWLYDGTQRQWVRIDRLQLDEEAPRSADDPEGLSAMLALELADTFGAEIGAATARQAQRYQFSLTQRLSTPRQAVPGVYF